MEEPDDISGPSLRTDIGAAGSLLLAVLGGGVGVLVVVLAIDMSMSNLSLDAVMTSVSTKGAGEALGSLAEVLAAVLGLSLTVVAIVVQLASQRYPAKIVDLFMFDKVNVATFAFMAASCVYVVVAPGIASTEPPPLFVVSIAVLLAVLNFSLLLPYFAYVFAFLEPTNLISQNLGRMDRILTRATDGGLTPSTLPTAQERISTGIERIADNCMAALTQSDRNLAVHSVKTLEGLIISYLSRKKNLSESWFDASHEFFGTLSDEFVDEVIEQKTWVETKSFLEYERVIRRALGEQNEVVSKIASSTHAIGEAALQYNEYEVVQLAVRFFNTYIRHGLNARNVRAVYNILYEYRRFARDVFQHDPELGRRIVEHLVYYGRTANDLGLPFVTVTVAHDVRVLCESVYGDPNVDMSGLLALFLSLDQPGEAKSSEVALIGVRKAQSILGSFFLEQGETDLAQRIQNDMKDENRARLVSIRDGILDVEERKFWEITDRGHNFDYVEKESHRFIKKFFEPLIS